MVKAAPRLSVDAVDTATDLGSTLAWLKKRGSKANREGMARYGIVATQVFGVSVLDIRRVGQTLGLRHDLAEPLWGTGWYEARMLVPFIADPARLTPAQMDRWARDFDNWAICDALTFHLFDRSPHAWAKVDQWASKEAEFVKRAAFALLAALALHDPDAADAAFLERLPTIEAGAVDARNFVKKGVSWALRSIGSRNVVLHAAALGLATRLSASPVAAVRWVGKDAARDLSRPLIAVRVAKKSAAAAARVTKKTAVAGRVTKKATTVARAPRATKTSAAARR
ncbi:MAG: DNA alkylation repair protein [Vicinamibacteraceae bacterium]